MARTFASVNEAWRELRVARNRAHEENDHAHHVRHGYDPNQPRVPKGHPDGGQWTDDGRAENTGEVRSDATPTTIGAQVRSTRTCVGAALWRSGLVTSGSRRRADKPPAWLLRRPGNMLHWLEFANLIQSGRRHQASVGPIRRKSHPHPRSRSQGGGGTSCARLEAPPRVPNQRPQTVQEENKVIVEVAHWMARHPEYEIGPSSWLYQHRVLIEAYCGPPNVGTIAT